MLKNEVKVPQIFAWLAFVTVARFGLWSLNQKYLSQ
jgi:hypothetical protein